MSIEPKVTIAKEQGTKNQWAKQAFYSRDGRKFTLQTKEVIWSMGVIFGLISVFMMLQGNSDNEKPKSQQSNIGIPDTTQASDSGINIPGVGQITNGGGIYQSKGHSKKEIRFTGPELLVREGGKKIPPGSSINAVLLSAATDGLVKAKTTQGLTVNGETKLSEGTLFLGTGSSMEDRLKIQFRQMVFQDGTFETISAEAFDESDQMVGLHGSHLGNEALKLGASIGLNFVGGLSEGLQENDIQGGVEFKKSNLKNAMLNGAATAALDQSREMMADMKNRHPAISVPANTKIIITFAEGN